MFGYVDYEVVGRRAHVHEYVLLSQSPRRRAMLAFLEPRLASNDIDERTIEMHYMDRYRDDPFVERAGKTCCEIAKAKSDVPCAPGTLYIASDTMVVHRDRIYNKPASAAEARAMLLSYFGTGHHVVTAVAMRTQDSLEVFYSVAEVMFAPLDDELRHAVEAYVRSGAPMDKAGAYGIQELDPRFVRTVQGDMDTIIGLPVSEMKRRLSWEE